MTSNSEENRLAENVDPPYPPPTEKVKENKVFKTKLVTALSEVLGVTHKLSRLDRLRHSIKQHKASSDQKEQHKQLMASFKDELIKKSETTKLALKAHEAKYYLTDYTLN